MSGGLSPLEMDDRIRALDERVQRVAETVEKIAQFITLQTTINQDVNRRLNLIEAVLTEEET